MKKSLKLILVAALLSAASCTKSTSSGSGTSGKSPYVCYCSYYKSTNVIGRDTFTYSSGQDSASIEYDCKNVKVPQEQAKSVGYGAGAVCEVGR